MAQRSRVAETISTRLPSLAYYRVGVRESCVHLASVRVVSKEIVASRRGDYFSLWMGLVLDYSPVRQRQGVQRVELLRIHDRSSRLRLALEAAASSV